MSKPGIVLFGGSFNPIHHGHLIVARSVAEQLNVDRVVLIPSAQPPHKQKTELAPADDRFQMAKLAVAGDPQFEISDIETRRSGPSYTMLTIEQLRQSENADVPLYWIIGSDTLSELHTWYELDRLVDACHILTAVRPGFETPDLTNLETRLSETQIGRLREGFLNTPRIDISATDIRRRIRDGRSIRFLAPAAVCRYIVDHRLYRDG